MAASDQEEGDGRASTGPVTASYVVARRIAVTVVGATLLALGAVLLLVPGPGLLVLSMGLAVLALEFAWARRWLRRLRERAAELGRAAIHRDGD